jgi:hypothetical protein
MSKAIVEAFDALWRRYQYVTKAANLAGEMNQLRLAVEALRAAPAPPPGSQGEEAHVCGDWKLNPSLRWVCGTCCGDAPPEPAPGYGDSIRVACPSCGASGFTRAELQLHRCAPPGSPSSEEPTHG